jgi:hypothetical protein
VACALVFSAISNSSGRTAGTAPARRRLEGEQQ